MGVDHPLGALMLVALGAMLVSCGIEDARGRTIANWKNAAIALAAPLWWWACGIALWPDLAIQLLVALVVFGLFAGAFAMGWMGGGDVKLIGALALWLPLDLLGWMLFAMSIAGGGVTIVMLLERALLRREGVVEVPYGVAIAAAGLLSIGQPILNHFPR